MSRYSVDGQTMTGIADAVRSLRHEKERMTPVQIEAKIRASRLGVPIVVSTHINPNTGEWERPSDWPDLDALAATIAEDEDCVYLTYDLRKTPGYGWIGIVAANAINGTNYYVERGHIVDGTFVTDESHATLTGQYFRQNLEDGNGDIQIWRVRSDDHMTRCHFASKTTTSAQNYAVSIQPCVERAGRMAHVTDLRSEGIVNAASSTWRYTTYWMERDAVKCGGFGVCTRMDGTWQGAYSLQSLDLSGWDTTNWAVNDTRNMFANCQILTDLTVPDSLGVLPAQASNVADHRPNEPCIQHFNGVKIYVSHTYAAALMLTPDSLRAILQRLPTSTGTKTITLSRGNLLKLTAEEIAVATQKGWTVA